MSFQCCWLFKVTFGQLKSLRVLDLKNNPLIPAVQKAAGPCITSADCQQCAKKVVALYQSMQSQLERERQKRAIEEEKVKAKVCSVDSSALCLLFTIKFVSC